MRVLIFSKYDINGASSRYRTYQYLPYLKEKDINYTVSFLFGNNYLRALYSKSQRRYIIIILCYINRFFSIIRSFNYDVLIIESELFPYFPSLFEYILKVFKKKYIVDYDDAIFHNYDLSSSKIVRFILRNKIKRVMRYAKVVIVGNDYLYQYAIKCNENVYKIPTVVSYDLYNIVKGKKEDDVFTIGWIGSPTTSYYLLPLIDVFREIQNPHIKFRFIGVDNKIREYFEGLSVDWVEWNPETEIADIKSFSVGIMPLDDSPWSRGKCGFKIVQYMACGIPVVASPVGANNEIVIKDFNGFLAKTNDDWFTYLNKLSQDIDLQKKMGKAGFSTFKNNYSTEAMCKKYLKIINP